MYDEHKSTVGRVADSLPRPTASIESMAAIAILNVITKGATVIVAAILVWGFNRIDRSLEEVNSTLNKVQLAIGRLETDRDNVRERISALETRMGHVERPSIR
jgi:hypothetical protein